MNAKCEEEDWVELLEEFSEFGRYARLRNGFTEGEEQPQDGAQNGDLKRCYFTRLHCSSFRVQVAQRSWREWEGNR